MGKETEDKTNLPIEIKSKSLANVTRNLRKNIVDTGKRAGKVVGGVGLLILGAGTAAIASTAGMPIIGTGLLVAGVVGGVKEANNLIYKTEPSLMFVTKKNADGSRAIYQNSLTIPSYLKGISISDKACIMGLQTLVGFQRYKIDLKESNTKVIEKDGKRIYDKTYSTVTHSVNLNNLKALEQAGYIEIVSEEENFYHNEYEKYFKFLGVKPRPLKSLLIAEK